eukprot:1187198-Rhodomonas_salina.1
MAMAGPSGHWDQGWVLLFWRESGRLLCKAFCMMVMKTAITTKLLDAKTTEETAKLDPYRVEWDDNGQPVVYTRYDCWVNRFAPAEATSGLVCVMQDPRVKSTFKPPKFDLTFWTGQKGAAVTDGAETRTVVDLPWKRNQMPRQFRVTMPAALMDTPGSYKTHAEMGKLEFCINTVNNMIPEEGDETWFPAWAYEANGGKPAEESD